MFAYQGKTALITGASSGIGNAFASELAGRGMSLILVVRSEEALTALAADLTARYPIRARVIVADLSREAAVSEIAQQVSELGRTVDLLINNTGFMTYGPFAAITPVQDHAEVMINVASVAGFQPIPHLAVYAATKAFVISFSVALWEKCRGRNVCIMGLCPGTTATELFDRASAPEGALGKSRTPAQNESRPVTGVISVREKTKGGFSSLIAISRIDIIDFHVDVKRKSDPFDDRSDRHVQGHVSSGELRSQTQSVSRTGAVADC